MTSLATLKSLRDSERLEALRFLGKFPDVRLSYWAFQNFKTCPQRYMFLIRRPAVPPVEDAYWSLGGSVVHSLFETFINSVRKGQLEWKDAEWLPESVESFYDREVAQRNVSWRDHGETPEEHRMRSLPQLRTSICYMHDALRKEGLIPCDPNKVYVEVPFETKIAPDITIAGRTDLVFDRDTHITIVDAKDVDKRSNVDWRQLIWYALGLEPVFNKPADRVGFILTKLRDWSWRNPNGRTYRADLVAEINQFVREIRAGEFPARINRHTCSYCRAQNRCPEWTQYAGASRQILDNLDLLGEGTTRF